MHVTICQGQTAEDRQRASGFRYQVYAEEIQRPQTYADPAARTLIKPLDTTGHFFVAEDELG